MSSGIGSVGGCETARCLRSGLGVPRDDGQIGTSVGSAGSLHDVECRDRTAETLSSTFPRSSRTATASTARATRLLIRICPSLASAHNRGRCHLRLKYPSSGLGARDLNAVSIICGALFLLGDAGLSDRH